MLNFINKYSFGIDISDATVEIIEMSWRAKDLQIEKYRFELESGIVKNGRLIDSEKLREIFIKNIDFTYKNISSAMLTANLPEEFCYLENFDLNYMDPDEFSTLIEKMIKENIPVPFKELSYSYQVTKESRYAKTEKSGEIIRKSGIIAAASSMILLEWQRFFFGLGFKSVAFEPSIHASFRSLFPSGTKREICIMDIGTNFTTFGFFNQYGNIYSFKLNIGGRTLSEMTANELKITIAEAEELKRKSRTDHNSEQQEILKVESDFFDLLAGELKAHLKFCTKKYAFCFKEIIVLGGASRINGLSESLEKRLESIKVKSAMLSNDFDGLEIEYATAIGLALRLASKKTEILFPAINPSQEEEYKNIWLRPAAKMLYKYFKRQEKKIAILILIVSALYPAVLIYKTIASPNAVPVPIKSEAAAENRQTIEMSLPVALQSSDYSIKVIRARVIKATIKRAVNAQMAILEAKRVATKNLLAGEKLYTEYLNKPEYDMPINYPFVFEWLAYNETDVGKVALSEAKKITGQGEVKVGKINIKTVENDNSNRIFSMKVDAEIIGAKKIENNFKENSTIEEKKATNSPSAFLPGMENKASSVLPLLPKYLESNTAIGVNARSGPGRNFKIIGKILPKVKYEIIEEGAGWKKIKISNTINAWVDNSFTKTVVQ
jgi:Tfp pilus assembly PilM family ATPase